MSYIIRWLWDGIYWVFQQIYNTIWGCVNSVITWILNIFFTLLDYVVYFISLIILCFYYAVDWILVSSVSFFRQFAGEGGIFNNIMQSVFGANFWGNINSYINPIVFSQLGLFFPVTRFRSHLLIFIGFLLSWTIYRFIARWLRG